MDHVSLEPDTALFAALRPRLLHADAGVRQLALLELGDSEDERHLSWLLQALEHDAEPEVRAQAASLLAAWEHRAVVEGLCRALLDPAAPVAQAAADSLTALKTPQAGLHLLPWLGHGRASVRCAILRALRELRVTEAAAPALQSLQDGDATVRREAVAVLGWLRHAPALPVLAKLLATDADADVRRAAAGALGFSVPASDDSAHALLLALRDSSWPVREEAATTLCKLQVQRAEVALIDSLDDSAWQVRLRAARALGRLRSVAAVGPLSAALMAGVGNVRREAAIALGEIGHLQAQAALQAAAADPDPEVRKAARLSLSRLTTPAELEP